MAVVAESPLRSPGQRYQFWRSLPAKVKVGALLTGVFTLVAIIGPWIAPYDPSAQSSAPRSILQPPNGTHLLGTTSTGGDVLSQILVGTRTTMEIGFVVGVIAIAIAVIVGAASGLLGGLWEDFMEFVTNVFLVLPALPLLAVLLAYRSARGLLPTIAVLSALGWPYAARPIMR